MTRVFRFKAADPEDQEGFTDLERSGPGGSGGSTDLERRGLTASAGSVPEDQVDRYL